DRQEREREQGPPQLAGGAPVQDRFGGIARIHVADRAVSHGMFGDDPPLPTGAGVRRDIPEVITLPRVGLCVVEIVVSNADDGGGAVVALLLLELAAAHGTR